MTGIFKCDFYFLSVPVETCLSKMTDEVQSARFDEMPSLRGNFKGLVLS